MLQTMESYWQILLKCFRSAKTICKKVRTWRVFKLPITFTEIAKVVDFIVSRASRSWIAQAGTNTIAGKKTNNYKA